MLHKTQNYSGIEPKHFFDTLEEMMGGLCFQVLEKIMQLATGDVPNILTTFWMLFPLGAKFPPLTEPPKQLDEFDPFTVSRFGKA